MPPGPVGRKHDVTAIRRNRRRAAVVARKIELHLVGRVDLDPQYRQLLLVRLVQKEQSSRGNGGQHRSHDPRGLAGPLARRHSGDGRRRGDLRPAFGNLLSCSLTSCAVCQRSSGSLARHDFTSRSKAGGVIGCRKKSEAARAPAPPPSRWPRSCPRRRDCPVVISYSTAPRAKMSERASAGFPSTCSGDMY